MIIEGSYVPEFSRIDCHMRLYALIAAASVATRWVVSEERNHLRLRLTLKHRRTGRTLWIGSKRCRMRTYQNGYAMLCLARRGLAEIGPEPPLFDSEMIVDSGQERKVL